MSIHNIEMTHDEFERFKKQQEEFLRQEFNPSSISLGYQGFSIGPQCKEDGCCEPPCDKMDEESILEEAIRLTSKDRQSTYGTPQDNMQRTADMWSAYLGHNISPRQVAICMILLKVAREAHMEKRDNLTDIAGWANVASEASNGRDKA